MIDRENFIARWSRRKRKAAQTIADTENAANAKPAAETDGRPPRTQEGEDAHKPGVADEGQGAAPEPSGLSFAVTKLPPIEAITAVSDIRPFLAAGVPPELTRAALRRAWSVDPRVRDFIGLSENSWDFNAPGAMAGFGPLEMTEELRREVARMVGRSLSSADDPAAAPAEVLSMPSGVEASHESVATTGAVPSKSMQSRNETSQGERTGVEEKSHNREAPAVCDGKHIAPQYEAPEPEGNPSTVERLGGRALPK